MNNISSVFKYLVSFLRYFVAPVVGLIIVLVFDKDQDILIVALKRDWTGAGAGAGTSFSIWPLFVFLGVIGITIYFAHRALFHPPLSRFLVFIATLLFTKKPRRPTFNDLAFARWYRRGAVKHTHENSTQSVLDEANAAGHFFYCSGWASLLIYWALNTVFPDEFTLSEPGWHFGIVVLVFFIIGLVSDWQTTIWDIEAYKRLPHHDNKS